MAVQRPPVFRGRSSERGVLDRLLDTARAGESGVLVIHGEPGIGKTSLLRHAARQAAGFRVIQIAGNEAEMELAFAGLHQLCAPFLDVLDALPEPQRDALAIAFGLSAGPAPDQFLVALATLSLLSHVAEDRPLLCLVDDAHWLDRASAQALGFVARRLQADSVALLLVRREDEVVPALAGLPELSVRGLDDEEARALLASVIPVRLDERVRDRIVSETHGNPLALLELARHVDVGQLAGGFALPDAGDVRSQIEDEYRRRVSMLPEPTQRLMLLAAADPVGDAILIWRAAQALGIEPGEAGPAESEHLLEIDTHVRFHHPLVRSAVYRAASVADRQTVHGALALATDPESDPDRRSWHRAHATTPPNEDVARELGECATTAERRGGTAAAAAFLERAVVFTPDPADRASRALAAAGAKLAAGDFAATESMLAAAELGPLDELSRVRVELTRGRIAFDVSRGNDAPALLLNAARRLEGLDPGLAWDTYLEALIASVYVGGLASDADAAAVARAALETPLIGKDPLRARLLAVQGLAVRLAHGYTAAAPTLSEAIRTALEGEPRMDWLSVAQTLAAMDLWDADAWLELASRQLEIARSTGTLVLLPHALDYLAGYHVQAGNLSRVAELMAESAALQVGMKSWSLPYMPLRIAALRGQASIAVALAEELVEGARARVEGSAVTSADYALAVLYNGLGQYERALEPALRAATADAIATGSWALYELVEAATRSGRHEVALDAAARLAERADASGTPWAQGAAARSQALVAEDGGAEGFYREAIASQERSEMAMYLARAHLSYGEWLRRENRRVQARDHLRTAHDMFTSMGADGFSERARHELLATGERVRARTDDVRDELTPQEEHIARLAREGKTNPEIGAELFLSPRTVEWHLRKVFAKLEIGSRRELDEALSLRRPRHPTREFDGREEVAGRRR